MVSGLLNLGTNGPHTEIFIYPQSAGWKKGGKEIGPLPHQRLLCLLGSARRLMVFFVFCGVAFSLLFVFSCVALWCVGGVWLLLWVVWDQLARGGQERPC